MKLYPPKRPIEYPDSDGKPVAENSLQYEWIVTIKANLESLFDENEDVFVAGDLLWYPVQGHPEICQAPDAMVAFGRPSGHRSSYKQWEEGGVSPHVVFEILSPGNRVPEMTRKFNFHQLHGVDEYYIYDPDVNDLTGYLRGEEGVLQAIPEMKNWISPRLGIRFDWTPEKLTIYKPDGTPFESFAENLRDRKTLRRDLELATWEKQQADAAIQRQAAEIQKQAADAQRQEADIQRQAADIARQAAEIEDLRKRLIALEQGQQK